MKRIRIIIYPVAIAATTALGALAGFSYEHQRASATMAAVEEKTDSFLKRARRIERNIIENHPIYSDFRSAQKEARLRTYLLHDHLHEASLSGMPPIRSEEQMKQMTEQGKLVDVQKEPSYYYFYNVRKPYRVLTPRTLEGLRLLGELFQKKLALQKERALAKFAISSLTRPDAYQKDLAGKNANAALESSHSYGVSVDIFYDDFYIYMEPDYQKDSAAGRVLDDVRVRTGFLMGDSLSRQLRSVLAESLLELQDAGLLYAIWERRQRVYHVTIRPKADMERIRERLLGGAE